MAKRKKPPEIELPAEQMILSEKQIGTLKNEMTGKQWDNFKNGLTEAIMGFQPGGIEVQLSQVDTIFKNQRWYLVSNLRQLLSEMYMESGLVQTVIDVPVDDAFRGGLEVHTKQLNEDQIKELLITADRSGDLEAVKQAAKWNRLYGGAGVLLMTDQDPSMPLDMNMIGEDSKLEFRAVDMWELFWDKLNTEAFNAELQNYEVEYFSYYGERIHKSRVLKMKGLVAPSFIRPRLRGWGFSVIEGMVRSINQYLKATDLTFEVLDEFKVDVFKIKNLANTLLNANGTEQVQKRIQLANMQKSYLNALTMDAEDDWDQKELSFTGIAETMAGIRMQVASDLRMPLTKLFGISAAGFNSGEDDIEVYNSMVEGQVRAKVKYETMTVLALRCKKLFGMIPDDLDIKFKPLRVLSAEQEENVKTQKFNRLLGAKTAGEIDSEEFRDACNRDNLLPMQLDLNKVMLEPDAEEDDASDEGEKKPAAPKGKSKLSAKEAPEVKNEHGGAT